ncbi:MAG: RHS repeat protein [Lachnospiraceae bacterium]|nr:RHS repeat protein [Lachnospiraceae bacterium]
MKRIRTLIIHTTLIIMIIASNIIVCHAADKEYEYDDSGRVTKVTYEDGSYETYEYDDNGNIIQITYTNASIDSSQESTTTAGNGDTTSDNVDENNNSQSGNGNNNTGDSNNGDGEDSSGNNTQGNNSSGSNSLNNGENNESNETNSGENKESSNTGNSTGDTSHLTLAIAIMGLMLVGIYTALKARARIDR